MHRNRRFPEVEREFVAADARRLLMEAVSPLKSRSPDRQQHRHKRIGPAENVVQKYVAATERLRPSEDLFMPELPNIEVKPRRDSGMKLRVSHGLRRVPGKPTSIRPLEWESEP
ncbi:MAG: hypothetical protein P4M11_02385 [Candidatus Pacebacteria bacterium]|nr:hypothetical protein [Candidatus Paceibacterota bacterium]